MSSSSYQGSPAIDFPKIFMAMPPDPQPPQGMVIPPSDAPQQPQGIVSPPFTVPQVQLPQGEVMRPSHGVMRPEDMRFDADIVLHVGTRGELVQDAARFAIRCLNVKRSQGKRKRNKLRVKEVLNAVMHLYYGTQYVLTIKASDDQLYEAKVDIDLRGSTRLAYMKRISSHDDHSHTARKDGDDADDAGNIGDNSSHNADDAGKASDSLKADYAGKDDDNHDADVPGKDGDSHNADVAGKDRDSHWMMQG